MPTHDIIDNREQKLIDAVRKILQNSKRAHFAVGYLFASGLLPIREELKKLDEIRLLIGNTTSRDTIEQLAEAHKDPVSVAKIVKRERFINPDKRKEIVEQSSEQIRETLALMDQTDENEELLAILRELVESKKLKVRIYTRGRLHSKAYIFDYAGDRFERGNAIVGSSNLSLSGLVDNTELNAVIAGNENHDMLLKWFDELWKQSDDFDKHLLQEINKSWALNQVRPYDIYIMTLYHLLKDRLEGEEARELLWEHTMPQLAIFQKVAVQQALQILKDYNGVIVGDVVGLGKTYIGVALLKHLQMVDGTRALVIAPPAIEDYWDDLLSEYGVDARVLSMGMLSQGEVDLQNDPKYRHTDVVLIDESHNFRHSETLRYKNLQPFLFGKKVILVTATPRNTSPWDIYYQLKLFHHDDPTLLPIDPPDLRKFFKNVDEGQTRIQDLLRHILIRRTRKHILTHYGEEENGQKFIRIGDKRYSFPERKLDTKKYSIDKTYRHLFDTIYKHLRGLTFAKYGLYNYVKPGYRTRSPYQELERAGKNLRGLMKVLLLKRFESSVAAFRETIHRLFRIHKSFSEAINRGFVPAGEEAQELLYDAEGEDEFLIMEQLETISKKYDAAAFNLEDLRKDTNNDIKLLQEIQKLVDPITPKDDDKLQELKKLLISSDVKDKKIIVFTQYADTAKYIYEQCVKSLDDRGNTAVAYSKTKNRFRVIRLFAPKSNNYKLKEGEREINILVSTDIISEGVNLQDADVVINYDIHWNPVRLIQRIGRLDRIGSLADIILVYNFLPERALEQHLKLHERVRQRIHEIHETIGEDAKILDKTEQLNEEAMYAIYVHRDSAALDEYQAQLDPFGEELFGLSEAEELLRQLKKENPGYFEYIRKMPVGIRSAKGSPERLNFVFCQAGNYQKLYLIDSEGKPISVDISTTLAKIKCEKEEDPISIPRGLNSSVMHVKQVFEKEVEERAGIKETVAFKPQQRYVVNQLQRLYEMVSDEERKREIERVKEAIKHPLPGVALQVLGQLRRNGTAGEKLFERVKEIYFQYGLERLIRGAREEFEEEPSAIVVCSMAMVPPK